MNMSFVQKIAISCLFLWGIYGGNLPLKAEVIKLNQDWLFQRLEKGQQTGEIRNQGSDWSSQYHVEHTQTTGVLVVPMDTLRRELACLQQGSWEKVNLPHTPRLEEKVVLHQWQGVCYYKRHLVALADWKDKEVWLEFGAAMHLADIWINGQHVRQHAGGYLPFVVDLKPWLNWEKENEILVRLDNRDNGLIPPGKPLNTLDFCYYGGLYRNVNLIVKGQQHITHPVMAGQVAGGGVFVRYPLVNPDIARISVLCEVKNAADHSVEVQVRHTLYQLKGTFSRRKKGKKVVEGIGRMELQTGKSGTTDIFMTVHEPRLWFPDAPSLYLLRSEVICNGRVTDCEETHIGIRRIEMTREHGFVINGKPLRLVGSNRHMEYPYVGNALPENAQYRDIYQIRSNGFNIVRLGHYPQDPSVLEACDELGLLVIEPIPGWQYFNRDSVFIRQTYQDIRDLIRRDRNHPSIVMWETTLNESWPPAGWKDEAVRIAHEEYPGDQCFTSGDAYGYDGFDVSYNDWQEGFHRPNKTKNPGFIREYYDYEFGGHYSSSRVTRGDGVKALLQNAWNAQWSHNRYRLLYPSTMGDAVWSMYDYNRGCCDNICYSGVADLFRLPKYSLHFFRTQVAPGTPGLAGKVKPEVFIASDGQRRLEETDPLVVFGNVEEVELFLNGKPVKRQGADDGEDSEYMTAWDGGNCRQLNFPPFTFTGITWETGELKAVGYIQGKKVVTTVVHTPGEITDLEIGYFESGRPAVAGDLLIVYVRLKDKKATLVPWNGLPVSLEVVGGQIVGPACVNTEVGVASFLVQTDKERKILLKAECREWSGETKIKVGKMN